MAMGNDVVHVAVKNDVKESRSTLVWALRNLGAKKVCILHVYQPNTASPAGNFRFLGSHFRCFICNCVFIVDVFQHVSLKNWRLSCTRHYMIILTSVNKKGYCSVPLPSYIIKVLLFLL